MSGISLSLLIGQRPNPLAKHTQQKHIHHKEDNRTTFLIDGGEYQPASIGRHEKNSGPVPCLIHSSPVPLMTP